MDQTSAFEYNAPQFRDFSCGFDLDDSDGADTFFDVENTETPKAAVPEGNKENQLPHDHSKTDQVKDRVIKKARRISGSLTKKDTETLSDDLGRLLLKRKSFFDGIKLNIDTKEEKTHTMTTRSDQAAKTPTQLELRTRVIAKEADAAEIKNERPNKRKSCYSGSVHEKKYIAMAERVLHFQKDTPPRFYSKRRSSIGNKSSMFKKRQSYNPRRTITLAKTPKLMTASRSRPSIFLTQQQKEEMELEEMKKSQIKARPLNHKIFKSPKLPSKMEKENTVQEPFNITEVFKKPAPKVDAEPFRFTAKPVPKALKEGKVVGLGPKPEIPLTIPASPAITKSKRPVRVCVSTITSDWVVKTESVHSFGVTATRKNRRTILEPFSFENRDKEMFQKKEQKILETMESQKKAREFKANPMPTFPSPKEHNRSTRSHLDTSKISTTSSWAEESHVQPFRHRSPTVLRKKPFKVKLESKVTEPLDIELYTERRRKEREQWEIRQLCKQEELACLKEMVDREKKMKEDEEVARLRKETVHKAQPVPSMKAIPPKQVSTIPLTQPQSPRFSKRLRHNTPCSQLAKEAFLPKPTATD